MMYLVSFFMVCLLFALIGVASNPSTYFGAGSLVFGAGMGCGILGFMGCSFVSIVLFLIYLGGMLVVFAYSVALSSDLFPEAWGSWQVGLNLGVYVLFVLFLLGQIDEGLNGLGVDGVESWGMSVVRVDLNGVSLLYGLGAGGLLVCGWGLLVALFVVLELTRGKVRVGLRAV
uniref:NADH-ubiquinone oxidoreductase chain 6 n=1 Tax=Meroles squamulosus TaxID=80448 RepID=A0A8A3WMA4_9SAUR|nr:NADH dehydrogenase subunit 6 [Meroles squamulosus]QTA72653.1 NADH dehydrogenase subunit 6 [Meroles squamulosus]